MKNTMQSTTRTSPSAHRIVGLAATARQIAILGILGAITIPLGSTQDASAHSAEKIREAKKDAIAAGESKFEVSKDPLEITKEHTGTSVSDSHKKALLPPDPCAITEKNPDCNGNGIADSCDLMKGFADEDWNGVLDLCQFATGDLDLDGLVGAGDLSLLLAGWGAAGGSGDCNDDGVADGADLSIILAHWSAQG